MSEWAVPAVALSLLAYAAVSGRLRGTAISQAMVFVALGLLLGTRLLGVVPDDTANAVVRHTAEAALALALFTDAGRLRLEALRRTIRLPVRLLGLGLPLSILLGTAAGLALLPGLDLWTAAALAAILAPTDAALGQPVVTNSRLPLRLRQGLNVESGLNDGICVPLLIIFLTLAEAEEGFDLDPLRIVVEEIGFGCIAGLAAGALGVWIARSFAPRGWISGTWTQIMSVAAPVLAYTSAVALGGSGFIAAFVAGIVVACLAGDRVEENSRLAEQSGELLGAVTFLLFGAVLLGPALTDLDWRIAAYAVLSLTVVRMLAVALAMLGSGMRSVTVAFVGWFGPRGLASIVFVLLLVEQTELAAVATITDAVTWTVALSVVAHGLTASTGARRFAEWYARHPRDAAPEVAVPVRATPGG